MERSATIARTNLADGETNVNRLRVPQFGIVSLCLSTPAKASKTYLQPGAKAPAPGADDFHFVPDKETIRIEYEMDDQGAIVDEGKLELFGRFDDDPLWTLDLEKLGPTWLSHGKHEVKWDGRIVKAAELAGKVAGRNTTHDLSSLEVKETDKFPDGYVTLEHSPYKLKLTVKSGALPRKKVVAWTYFQILLKSISIELGPEEAIPKGWFGGARLERDKKVRKQIETDGGLPAKGGSRAVYLPSNLFKTKSKQMYDNTAFDLYKKLWDDGPNVPVIARIRLADSNDAEVKLELDKSAVALGNARFLWEWEDKAEVPTNTAGSNPRAFIDAAIDYYKAGADPRSAGKDHTYPKGDNCHVDRGGKRGPDADPIFPKQSGYKPKTPLEAGEFPFNVESCKERLWASFSRGWGKGKLAGRTGALFQPSRMAGDDYTIRVFLAWDHDKDGRYVLDVKTEPLAAAASIQAETGVLQIWRELHLSRYVRKRASILNFLTAANIGLVKGTYAKAYINVLDKRGADDSYLIADHKTKSGSAFDYNAAARKLVEKHGDFLLNKHYAADPAADHAAEDCTFKIRRYPDFVRKVHDLENGAAGAGDLAALIAANAPTPADQVLGGLGTAPIPNPTTLAPATPPATRGYISRLWKTQRLLVDRNVDTDINYSNTLTALLSDLYEPLLDKMEPLAGGKSGAAGDGIAIIQFNYLHNVVRDFPAATAGVAYLQGAAVDVSDASHEKCVFVFFTPGTSPADVDTFNHEVGHHLFMPHSRYHVGNAIAPGKPLDDRHDDDDQSCLMSYSTGATTFCGLCQLRLRGWDATALDKDDAKNKKP